jgi:hypothetical protein
MIRLLIFVYALSIISQVSANEFLCAYGCVCNFKDPIFFAECSRGTLKELPYFNTEITNLAVNYINLYENLIENLDEEIINKWKSLKGIDLRRNPTNCSQLGLFQKEVTVVSDCQENVVSTSGGCTLICR